MTVRKISRVPPRSEKEGSPASVSARKSMA